MNNRLPYTIERRNGTQFVTFSGIHSTRSARGRLSASRLKALAPSGRNSTLNATAQDAPIPIAYGELPLREHFFAVGSISTDLVLGVAWCFGEIEEISKIYINDEEAPAAVILNHHLGTATQGVDPILAAGITAFSDNMVLSTPEGDIGIAYTVLRIPPGEVDSIRSIRAIVKGRKVYDERIAASPTELYPNYADVALRLTFDGVNEQTDIEDFSDNDLTITCVGDAELTTTQKAFGTASVNFGGAGSVEVTSLPALGTGDFKIAFRIRPTVGSATQVLFDGRPSGTEGLYPTIYINSANKLIFYTDSGDRITGATNVATNTQQHVELSRSSGTTRLFLDGVEQGSSYSDSNDYLSVTDRPVLGVDGSGAGHFTGQIDDLIIDIGNPGETANFTPPTEAYPTAQFESAWQYSDNSALCMADLISNSIFGMGSTVYGATEAADWCDTLIESAARCRIAIALTEPRPVTDYMDLKAEYGECVWFPEGDGIRIKPDRLIGADNPCGLDIVTNGDFSADSDWTKGDGWSISGGNASSDGTQVAVSSLTQSLTTEDGVKYALSVTLSGRSAGAITVEWDGLEVIAENTDGTYTYAFTASGTSNDIEIIADADFVGDIDDVSVKRLYWHAQQVVGDSLRLDGLDQADSPTRVFTRYTNPSTTSAAWPELRTSVSLPGYDVGDIPAIETYLDLRGVHRLAEASNKANSKLQRMVNRLRVSWQTTDEGIVHQLADVLQLDRPTFGVDALVWVESISMVDYGRYQVSGLRYDESHYPNELVLPDDAGTVPVGAIVLNSGMSVPAGWAAYTDADGNFIIGAGDTYSVADTGGADTHAGFSGDTSSVNSHGSSPSYTTFKARRRNAGGIFGAATRFPAAENPATTHDHTYATGTITPDPYRRDTKLIIKTGSPSATFPAQAQVFGLTGLNAAGLARVTSAAGQLIKAATANATAGTASKFVAFTSGATSDAHDHEDTGDVFNDGGDIFTNETLYTHDSGGGSHTHSYNLALSRAIKRRRMALYSGTDDYAVLPGMIVLWSGSLASLPTDWALCDGTGLTPDLTDHFIEIADIGNEETADGDNTISISGFGSSVGHDHQGSSFTSTERRAEYNHSNTLFHAHSVSDSGSWTPPYYALAAIMFAPS